MPTYDYQCDKCEFEFEREQRITEDPIKTCPKCKARKVKRLLSAPNFILKGGGWYADGYGTSGAGKASSKSDGDDSSSSKSDSSADKSSGSGSGDGDSGEKSKGKKKSKPTDKSAA